ncbi:hypothetical protein AVEN_203345-1 [Araneus ventricosus]|uniref:Uncharacterized protein n=2 Tax=Araneus ventricosus TaxID=182803 RepID=A0A4Y2U7P4_ARAVE|nr:hypothetical protein AVEN_203345-1 [Araneus ventricosus]
MPSPLQLLSPDLISQHRRKTPLRSQGNTLVSAKATCLGMLPMVQQVDESSVMKGSSPSIEGNEDSRRLKNRLHERIREGKAYRQGQNLSNLQQMIRNGGIQQNLKSKTQSADSNLGPRCEGSGKTKDLSTLTPRVEARNETRNHPRGGGKSVGGRNSAPLVFVSKETLEHP